MSRNAGSKYQSLPVTHVFHIPFSNDYRKLRGYMRRRNLQHQATIRRTHLSEDSFREFNKLGKALKGSIQITFLDE